MEEQQQATEEIFLNIPLRDAKSAPRTRRADAAINIIRDEVARKTKSDVEDVWVDPKVNEKIWNRGRKKIPSRVRVRILKLQDGTTEVVLP
ncbi:MAG: 50S ribosomal protein L31e [Candidatus Thermoplasmatota archaeon]|nr:50S ribosomal protein L31e [Candidatus Thermoplasmatota archaeon]MCL5731607.1 50S ribosomal protein L31e [Candidatus Thermoplasmatota archaeon]